MGVVSHKRFFKYFLNCSRLLQNLKYERSFNVVTCSHADCLEISNFIFALEGSTRCVLAV